MLPQISSIYDHSGIPNYLSIINLSGLVTKNDVKAYEADIYEKLDTYEKIGIVVDMSDMSDMTEDALAKDLRFEMQLFTKLQRFPKIAIISEKKIIKTIVKYFNPVIPFIEMKVFLPDQTDKAITFAANIPVIKIDHAN